MTDTAVSGVGNVKTKANGRGTVELMSTYNGHNYTLQLENVLYIPSNRNNLISLGRWDKAGGWYTRGGGELTLITKDGTPVARGTQIANNLYKMEVAIRQLKHISPILLYLKDCNKTNFIFELTDRDCHGCDGLTEVVLEMTGEGLLSLSL